MAAASADAREIEQLSAFTAAVEIIVAKKLACWPVCTERLAGSVDEKRSADAFAACRTSARRKDPRCVLQPPHR